MTPTPMQVLAQALRDELIATRFDAGIDSPRAMARILGLEPDQGHIIFWRFERGRAEWPRRVDEFVQSYSDATGVPTERIWLGTARRWVEALAGGKGSDRADRISQD